MILISAVDSPQKIAKTTRLESRCNHRDHHVFQCQVFPGNSANLLQGYGFVFGIIGIAAIYSDGLINLQGMTLTAAMITMAVFGAIVMYIMSMLSLFKLRKTAPDLERSFIAPGFPVVPGIALAIAVVCLIAMAWYNMTIGLLFIALMVAGLIYFHFTAHHRADAPIDLLLTGADPG